MKTRGLVIGIGNADRGDDGVGLAVARALADRVPPGVAIEQASGDGASLIDAWQGFDIVVLVDAMSPLGNVGSIHRLEAHAHPLPANLFADSTHAFGVAHGVEMARALGLLPPMLIIYGIAGRDFTRGAPISAEVAAAIPRATAAILDDLARLMPE